MTMRSGRRRCSGRCPLVRGLASVLLSAGMHRHPPLAHPSLHESAAVRPRMPGMVREREGGFSYSVWAPALTHIEIVPASGSRVQLMRHGDGWHTGILPSLAPGERYRVVLDGGEPVADPLSRWQPDGLGGASAAWDHDGHRWQHGCWRGLALEELVIYELHVGTFTPEGTLDGAIGHLGDLVDLGITAIELMPLSQTPGTRNWGYDGVMPFAIQHSVGGPAALQRFVDACHGHGLAVILDVVYNHFGPEGNHLGRLLPLYREDCKTPWGAAINLDGPGSDGVRELFLATAWQWFAWFGIDGLRLDAVHALVDTSAVPFLRQIAEAVRCWQGPLGRQVHLIAESDLNASRIITPIDCGGYGMSAQWMDDFHHSLHALLTGERSGYYADFGELEHLQSAFEHGYVYDGRYSACRRRTYGDDASWCPTIRFVVYAQNHDQIGNRMLGERLSRLTDGAGLRCAAAAVLLSPYVPLIFMGEEVGSQAPFLYFADFSDLALVASIKEGRSREFQQDGVDPAPDPMALETAAACHPFGDRASPAASRLRQWYKACLAERRARPSLRPGPRCHLRVDRVHARVIAIDRSVPGCRTVLLLNPTAEPAEIAMEGPGWHVVLHSDDHRFGGTQIDAVQPNKLALPARSAALLSGPPR